MEEQIVPVFKLIVPFYWKMCLMKWKKPKNKYHAPISKSKILKTKAISIPLTHTVHDYSLSWLGRDTSMKKCRESLDCYKHKQNKKTQYNTE